MRACVTTRIASPIWWSKSGWSMGMGMGMGLEMRFCGYSGKRPPSSSWSRLRLPLSSCIAGASELRSEPNSASDLARDRMISVRARASDLGIVEEDMHRLNTSIKFPPSGPGIRDADMVELRIGCLDAKVRIPFMVSNAASFFFLKEVWGCTGGDVVGSDGGGTATFVATAATSA